jgi:hypothetical protein
MAEEEVEQGKYIVPSDEEIRAKAKAQHGRDGKIEIEQGGAVSISEGIGDEGPCGAYVQSWVYVAFEKNPEYRESAQK